MVVVMCFDEWLGIGLV